MEIVQLELDLWQALDVAIDWEWERQYNPTEPVMDVEGCTDLFVQSLHLDLSDLIEPPETVEYPQNRQPPTAIAINNSLVGQVDKSAVLAMVRQLEAEDNSTLCRDRFKLRSESTSSLNF